MSALPILDLKENSFRIQTSNFNSVLSKVGDRPFVLISINGATRTGKSFALNYFIRYLTFKTGTGRGVSSSSIESWMKLVNAPKFVARSGRTRTTLGIDLWSEPFIIKVDGREIAVLLMDCQGLFDEQTTGTQNAIIFSLSSLCSSMSVFNLMRNIDESTLQQIQFFSDYAHLVSQEKEQENNLDSFQRLIFLIRDVDFPDYDYGYHGNESSSTGGKNFFREVFHSSAQIKMPPENLFVREEILRSYKDVGCFLLPHPGKQFTQNDKKPTDEDFDQSMKEFVELVLSPQNLVTKRIGGQEITGNDFKRFVEEWGELCKNAKDHFPAVQTIAESTATIQNTLALNTATAHYEKVMSSFVESHPRGLPDSEFLKLHEQLKLEALKIFNDIKKLGGDELAEEYRQSLIELTSKLRESSRQVNLILVSKAKTEKELKENKKKVTEVQGKLSHLEVQTKRDKEQQEKVIGGLHNKMAQEAAANATQRKNFQDQLTAAQVKYNQLTQAAEESRKSLAAQIAATEARFQESERRHQEALVALANAHAGTEKRVSGIKRIVKKFF